MGVVDPACKAGDDPSCVLPCDGPVCPLQPIGERDSGAICGHHVRHVTRSTTLMNRDDVGVTEPGGRLGLDGKPMPRLRVEPHRGVWNLDRDLPVENRVVRQVDDSEPAAAQLPKHLEPTDRRERRIGRVGRGAYGCFGRRQFGTSRPHFVEAAETLGAPS